MELERLKSNIETVPQAVTTDLWDEVTDNWSVFVHLVADLKQDRSIVVAKQVFKDPALVHCIGMARQLRDIDNPDDPPYGLLQMLKQAQMIVKKNINHFVISIDNEIMQIETVKRYKMRILSAASSLFLSTLIALGNVAGNWYLEERAFGNDL